MKIQEIYIGIYFLSALQIQISHCNPRDEQNKGNVDLLDFQFHEDDVHKLEKDIDTIIAESWADTWEASQEMKDWFPYRIIRKNDDSGASTVVFYKEFGKWKFVDLVKTRGQESRDDFDKYYEQYLHRLFIEAEKAGAEVIAIIDFDGFSIQNLNNRESFQLGLRQISTLEKSSRAVKQAYLVNTNFVAQTFLNVARPLLGTALEKTEIYGTQRDKWLPHMLKDVPKEVVPAEFFEKQ